MDKEKLINKYFEDTLTSEEQLMFKSILESDAAFAEQLTFEKQVRAAIHLQERLKIKQKLQIFENQQFKPQNLKKIGLVAASLLFILTSYWVYNLSSKNTEKIFANYYQAYPNTLAPIVRGVEEGDSLQFVAFELYEAKKYAESIEIFEKLYARNNNPSYILYIAICQVELQNFTTAISTFNKLQEEKNIDLKASSYWYLALIYLKQNDKAKATEYLQKLETFNNAYSQQSVEVLKKIKD